MNRSELAALLRLLTVPGIGAGRVRSLVGIFGSAQNVIDAPVQRLSGVPGIEKFTAARLKQEIDHDFAEEQLAYVEEHDLGVITFWDANYPRHLKKIYDPPALFFIRGSYLETDAMALAVVGTRTPTRYGRIITEKVTREASARGFTIISGLARGVDTIAHRIALQHGGRTIAVLGSGLDQIYPAENCKLADKICSNGAIISEYPIGTKPDAVNFPKRNRIVSGLSLGVVVTEAGPRSGALITAYQALEQNREVFAIPGQITNPESQGSNQLIKEGAKLTSSISDITEELDQVSSGTAVQEKIPLPDLKPEEQNVYTMLGNEPHHIDLLIKRTGKPVPEILSILLTLELLGLVKQLSGKMFIRNN